MCHSVALHIIISQLRISALPSIKEIMAMRNDQLTVHNRKKNCES